MRIIADTHTHTLASGHAFGTVTENTEEARRKNLEFLCLCEHTKAMVDAQQDLYFESTLASLPLSLYGVYLIRGCETNILGRDGSLDMEHDILSKLEWVIASMHSIVIDPMSKDACTEAWLAIAANPDVDVIGHCGDGKYPFDHETVVKACKETGTIIEINSHSFAGGRKGSPENCRDVARLCMKYEVPVVVCSDAHFWTLVGDFTDALAMLDEVGFPEELVINAKNERMARVFHEKCGRAFPSIV